MTLYVTVYMKLAGSLPSQDVMHYEQLKAGVIQHYLLVDNLIYKVLVIFA